MHARSSTSKVGSPRNNSHFTERNDRYLSEAPTTDCSEYTHTQSHSLAMRAQGKHSAYKLRREPVLMDRNLAGCIEDGIVPVVTDLESFAFN